MTTRKYPAAALRPISDVVADLVKATTRFEKETANRDVLGRMVDRLSRERGLAVFSSGRFALTAAEWLCIASGERPEPLSAAARRRADANLLREALGPAEPALVALVARVLR